MKRILRNTMMMLALIVGWQQSNAQTCTACFTATPDSNTSTLINVDASCSTPASFFANFEWIIDGVSWGSTPTPYFQIPLYVAGTHTIELVYTGLSGCTDSTSQVITVTPTCNASFQAYDGGNGTGYFYFNNYYASGTYSWDYGDGSTGTSTQHAYAAPGTYNVCCVYSDTAFGCIDTFCTTVNITGSSSGGACNAVLTAGSYLGTTTIYGDAFLSAYNFGVSTFEFYVNGTLQQSGVTSTFYYGAPAAGTYTVTMNILDTSGAICDADSAVVSVSGGGPTGCFACFYPLQITTDTFTFDASCSNTNGGSLAWSIDGAPYVAGPSTWTQGFTVGYHYIGLKVIDSNGTACDSVTSYIYVTPPPCNSCLAITQVAGSTSDYVFDASCTGSNIASTTWLVNGQYVTTSNSPTFNYSFTSSGTYDVCVYTVDSFGNYCNQTCSTLVVTTPTATQFDINGTVYKFSNSFWGYYAPVGNAEAKVYLITLQPGGQLDAVDSTTTDAFGHYSFQNKIVNDYRIKVALDGSSPDYMWNIPTYYQSGTMWYDANVITLFTNLYGRDIYMAIGTNTGGPGFISGNVFAGANKKARSTDRTEVTLMLVDASTNTPVMYAKPNTNGDYSFSNVPLGTYKLVGELLNRASIADNIDVTSGSSSFTGKNFVFTDNVVKPTTLALNINKPSIQTNLSVLPNPAQNELRISTTATDGTITVYDVTGRVVTGLDMKNATSARIDCSAWQAGMYVVEQATSAGKTTMKVSKQ
jgi:hypothetical protein